MLLTGTAQPARANPDGFSDQIVDATVIGVNIYRARGATHGRGLRAERWWRLH